MASSLLPIRGAQYVFYVALRSQSDTKLIQANPTLATGDVKVSTDGGTLGNITTLPTVTPASGRQVKVTLSAAEMTGDRVGVAFVDAAGAEWCDLYVEIATVANGADSLSTYAGGDTSGTTTLLSRLSATRAGYLDNLSAGAVALASALATAQTDLTTLLSRLSSARAGYLDALAGWTGTIRQALRAMAAKAAGESSSDLTGGSSTYLNTTDSQEAIRDNMSGSGVTAADVWTYTSRSLTTPVAASTDGTLAGAITRKRGDRWSIQRTALGAVTGYTTLWFTLKDQTSDADTSAVLQATVAGGLLRLNGSTSVTSGHVTITVDDASTGDITIVVLPAATAQLAPRAYEYDVQVLIGSAVTTLEQGRFTVTADVTRSTS